MTFPITIVDNFFDDPDAIVETANNLKYFNPQGGHWPGTRTKNLHIDEPRFHVNGDGSIRAEPGSLQKNKDTTITDEYDMYFGGVCVSGLNNGVFSFGDKRRGDTSWVS